MAKKSKIGNVTLIKNAALLHDIGKLGISRDLLYKEGPLSEEEFNVMKKHVIIGKNILIGTHLKEIRNIILYHHKYLDGSGYPEYLDSRNIPIESQILTIADIFDALTSDRPYREKMSFKEAIRIIKDYEKTKLNSTLVANFESIAPRLFSKYHDSSKLSSSSQIST